MAPHPGEPDPRTFGSLLEILESAAVRFGDRPLLGLATDTGTEQRWSARDLMERARLAAWRLRALGLAPGDRILTWSPSGPDLYALYYGAMLAGVVVVPLDLQMTPEVVERIAGVADTRWLVHGTGRDAPDLRAAGLAHLQRRSTAALVAEPRHRSAAEEGGRSGDDGSPDADFPPDWEQQVAAWPRPDRSSVFEIVFTSGTTGNPKGVVLTHGNILATVEGTNNIVPPWEHRLVSLLPLSHLFGQVEMFYVLFKGADVLYLRSRNPRVIFAAIRAHRVTTMVVVPQVLQLFWNALTREVEKQGRLPTFQRARRIARHLPYPVRRWIFRRVHEQFGGQLRLFISAAAFLPPGVQEAWEDLGVVVMQGYGATECGFATATSLREHPKGTVGRSYPPTRLRLAPEDGEILVGGPTVFSGYWRDPDATAAALDADGWYHTGDVGRLDQRGYLILSGRKKNMIALPNGLKVYPEDIENALRVAGLGDAVALETEPGRIEAVILPPDVPMARPGSGAAEEAPTRSEAEDRALRERVEAAVKAANATLAAHQRVVGWRLWTEGDFPRTHTLKIRRDLVRRWAVGDEPAPVPEKSAVAATARHR